MMRFTTTAISILMAISTWSLGRAGDPQTTQPTDQNSAISDLHKRAQSEPLLLERLSKQDPSYSAIFEKMPKTDGEAKNEDAKAQKPSEELSPEQKESIQIISDAWILKSLYRNFVFNSGGLEEIKKLYDKAANENDVEKIEFLKRVLANELLDVRLQAANCPMYMTYWIPQSCYSGPQCYQSESWAHRQLYHRPQLGICQNPSYGPLQQYYSQREKYIASIVGDLSKLPEPLIRTYLDFIPNPMSTGYLGGLGGFTPFGYGNFPAQSNPYANPYANPYSYNPYLGNMPYPGGLYGSAFAPSFGTSIGGPGPIPTPTPSSAPASPDSDAQFLHDLNSAAQNHENSQPRK